MKKRKIGLLSLGGLLIFLASCTSNGGFTKESGDFKYKINTSTGEVMLIGFTDEGAKKETIVVPTMIDNRKVTLLAYMTDFLFDDGTGTWKANFDGSYTSIYFHSFIKYRSINSGCDLIHSGTSGNKKFFGSYTNYMSQNYDPNLCYTPRSVIYDNLDSYFIQDYNSSNVVYYLNDGTNKTFFCDDADNAKVNVIPPDPYRDNYNFTGWYLEPECKTEFDFENYIIPKKEYDSDGDAIYNETKIYAGWEKI